MILLAALILRAPFWPLAGYPSDARDFAVWTDYAVHEGVLSIYDDPETQLPNRFVNYPPGYLYMLDALGRGFALVGGSEFNSANFLTLRKSLTFLFEAIAGVWLLRFASRRWNRRAGLWAMGLYLLNPALIYLSAYYGQVDSIFGFFLTGSLILLIDGRAFWAGCLLSLSLWTKIQTLPFIPLFMLVGWTMHGNQRTTRLAGGVLAGSAAALAPFWLTGRLGAVIANSVLFNFNLGRQLSVGAFNLWYLHANPNTFDGRAWGWLYGGDGFMTDGYAAHWLTYKNLGMALFVIAYGWILRGAARRRGALDAFTLAAAAGLIFFMLPTRVHERYLFAFFPLFAIPAALNGRAMAFYVMLSIPYLANLMTIAPLISPPPALETTVTAFSVACAAWYTLDFAVFMASETFGNDDEPRARFFRMAKTAGWTLAALTIVLWLRGEARTENPGLLYLSHVTPAASTQDWPPMPPELKNPPPGFLLGRDLSVDGEPLCIDGVRYRYGIGTHANARIDYDVPPGYDAFEAWAGIDAETLPLVKENPSYGQVRFSVLVNGEEQPGAVTLVPTMPARRIMVRLDRERANRLTLIAEDGGDGIDADHADWALARVLKLR